MENQAAVEKPKKSCCSSKSKGESDQTLKEVVSDKVSTPKPVSVLETYWPVIMLVSFSVGFGVQQMLTRPASSLSVVSVFTHTSMGAFLAGFSFFKMLDVEGFASSFAQYDLLASRSQTYARLFPFIEAALAFAYLSLWTSPALYLFTIALTTVGLLGVLKSLSNPAPLKCACMGSLFSLPLSRVAVIENGGMLLMALGMLVLMP